MNTTAHIQIHTLTLPMCTVHSIRDIHTINSIHSMQCNASEIALCTVESIYVGRQIAQQLFFDETYKRRKRRSRKKQQQTNTHSLCICTELLTKYFRLWRNRMLENKACMRTNVWCFRLSALNFFLFIHKKHKLYVYVHCAKRNRYFYFLRYFFFSFSLVSFHWGVKKL